MKLAAKMIVFWFFVLICLMLLWVVVQRSTTIGKDTEVSYSDLFIKVQQGLVLDATIQGSELRGHLKAAPGDRFHTALPANHAELIQALLAARVNFKIQEPSSGVLKPLLVNLGVMLGGMAICFLLVLPPFWTIFKKAGFQPILSVLMLVPVLNLILLYYVSFSEWKTSPAQKS